MQGTERPTSSRKARTVGINPLPAFTATRVPAPAASFVFRPEAPALPHASSRRMLSSAASMRADSFRQSEIRSGQDTKRYVTASAANSQNLAVQFLRRLRGYQLFSSVLTETPNGVRYDPSTDHKPWNTVDRVMMTTPEQLLKGVTDTDYHVAVLDEMPSSHNNRPGLSSPMPDGALVSIAEEVEEGGSILSPQPDSAAGTVPAASSNGIDTTTTALAKSNQAETSRAGAGDRGGAASSRKKLALDTWALASETDRVNDRDEMLWRQQRDNVISGLRHTYPTEEDDSVAGDQRLYSDAGNKDNADNMPELSTEANMEQQRLSWTMFNRQEDFGPSVLLHRRQKTKVVYDYLKSNVLHEWLESRWQHHTHRHESAALRIQQAYRCAVARATVRRRRYERVCQFRDSLQVESECKKQLEMSLQIKWERGAAMAQDADLLGSTIADDISARTLKAVRLFIDKINAIITRKRAQREEEERERVEMETYAATTIQRVYRGYRSRRIEAEKHDPEHQKRVLVAKRNQNATVLQRACLRYLFKKRCLIQNSAAEAIQAVYRSYAARKQLRALREQDGAVEEAELQRAAVATIWRCYLRFKAKKEYQARAPLRAAARLVQRVGRGYRCRQDVLGTSVAANAEATAIQLQRWWRRENARVCASDTAQRRLTEQEAYYNSLIQTDAAVTIQRWWSQHKVRR